jgi:hypothetical protein
MTNDSEDIHNLWQAQPKGAQRVPPEVVRAKAERLETKTRRWRRVGAAVLIVLLIASSVEILWPGQDIVERTGDSLTLAALLYIAYEYRKYGRSRPERGQTSCVEFYRAQLTYERNLAQQSWRFLLPFIPGIALSISGGVLDEGIRASQRISIVVLAVALFLGVAWLNAHTARKYQKEIDAVEAL